MRFFLVLLLAVLVGLAAYYLAGGFSDRSGSVGRVPAGPPPSRSAPSPASSPVPPGAGTTSAPDKAPAGVWFFRERVSVSVGDTIHGFAPGTPCEEVRDLGAALLVRADGRDLEVAKSKLTNDAKLARELAAADAARGAAQARQVAAARSAAASDLRQTHEQLAGRVARQESADRARDRAQIEAQIADLRSRAQALRAEAGRYREKERLARLRGHSSSYAGEASARDRDAQVLEQRANQLQAELSGQ